MPKNAPFWIHKDKTNGFEAAMKGWPQRPTWLVDALAPGIDYFTIAGFPTWLEAMEYVERQDA